MNFAEVPNEVQTAQIEWLMSEYGTELLRVCYFYLKDVHQAEDAAQESFIKAYTSLHSFRGGHIKAWLMRIAINTCKDYLRSFWFKRVDRKVSLDDLSPIAAGALEYDGTVFDEVMNLPLKHREVILLRYYQGFALAEIGEVLGLTVTGVQSRLERAKRLLHQKLERWYFDG